MQPLTNSMIYAMRYILWNGQVPAYYVGEGARQAS